MSSPSRSRMRRQLQYNDNGHFSSSSSLGPASSSSSSGSSSSGLFTPRDDREHENGHVDWNSEAHRCYLCEKENGELQFKLDKMIAHSEALRVENETLRSQVSHYESSLSNLRRVYEEQIEFQSAETKLARHVLSEKSIQFERVLSIEEERKREVTLLQSALQQREQESRELQTAAIALRRQVEGLRKEAPEMQQRLAESQGEVLRLRGEVGAQRLEAGLQATLAAQAKRESDAMKQVVEEVRKRMTDMSEKQKQERFAVDELKRREEAEREKWRLEKMELNGLVEMMRENAAKAANSTSLRLQEQQFADNVLRQRELEVQDAERALSDRVARFREIVAAAERTQKSHEQQMKQEREQFEAEVTRVKERLREEVLRERDAMLMEIESAAVRAQAASPAVEKRDVSVGNSISPPKAETAVASQPSHSSTAVMEALEQILLLSSVSIAGRHQQLLYDQEEHRRQLEQQKQEWGPSSSASAAADVASLSPISKPKHSHQQHPPRSPFGTTVLPMPPSSSSSSKRNNHMSPSSASSSSSSSHGVLLMESSYSSSVASSLETPVVPSKPVDATRRALDFSSSSASSSIQQPPSIEKQQQSPSAPVPLDSPPPPPPPSPPPPSSAPVVVPMPSLPNLSVASVPTLSPPPLSPQQSPPISPPPIIEKEKSPHRSRLSPPPAISVPGDEPPPPILQEIQKDQVVAPPQSEEAKPPSPPSAAPISIPSPDAFASASSSSSPLLSPPSSPLTSPSASASEKKKKKGFFSIFSLSSKKDKEKAPASPSIEQQQPSTLVLEKDSSLPKSVIIEQSASPKQEQQEVSPVFFSPLSSPLENFTVIEPASINQPASASPSAPKSESIIPPPPAPPSSSNSPVVVTAESAQNPDEKKRVAKSNVDNSSLIVESPASPSVSPLLLAEPEQRQQQQQQSDVLQSPSKKSNRLLAFFGRGSASSSSSASSPKKDKKDNKSGEAASKSALPLESETRVASPPPSPISPSSSSSVSSLFPSLSAEPQDEKKQEQQSPLLTPPASASAPVPVFTPPPPPPPTAAAAAASVPSPSPDSASAVFSPAQMFAPSPPSMPSSSSPASPQKKSAPQPIAQSDAQKEDKALLPTPAQIALAPLPVVSPPSPAVSSQEQIQLPLSISDFGDYSQAQFVEPPIRESLPMKEKENEKERLVSPMRRSSSGKQRPIGSVQFDEESLIKSSSSLQSSRRVDIADFGPEPALAASFGGGGRSGLMASNIHSRISSSSSSSATASSNPSPQKQRPQQLEPEVVSIFADAFSNSNQKPFAASQSAPLTASALRTSPPLSVSSFEVFDLQPTKQLAPPQASSSPSATSSSLDPASIMRARLELLELRSAAKRELHNRRKQLRNEGKTSSAGDPTASKVKEAIHSIDAMLEKLPAAGQLSDMNSFGMMSSASSSSQRMAQSYISPGTAPPDF